jgi:hypothetical protein
MKITNKLGLPQPIVDAVANDPYTRGSADISVTGLLQPPRKTALDLKHEDELEEDAADRIWALFGQALHTVLERASTTGISERRLSININGWKVSGAVDRYVNGDLGLIQDYKFVTVWKFKDDGVPEEYEQQLNCYAAILRHHKQVVKRLEIVGILRDWSKMEAERNPTYPQSQIVLREVPMWSDEKALAFMTERVIAHQNARKKLPVCTPEERWQKPTVWAVQKPGAKRAVRLWETEAEAKEHAASDSSLSVIERPGESVRCKAYCSASKFCAQYQAEVKRKEAA